VVRKGVPARGIDPRTAGGVARVAGAPDGVSTALKSGHVREVPFWVDAEVIH